MTKGGCELFLECDVKFFSNLICSTFGLKIATVALFRTNVAPILKIVWQSHFDEAMFIV